MNTNREERLRRGLDVLTSVTIQDIENYLQDKIIELCRPGAGGDRYKVVKGKDLISKYKAKLNNQYETIIPLIYDNPVRIAVEQAGLVTKRKLEKLEVAKTKVDAIKLFLNLFRSNLLFQFGPEAWFIQQVYPGNAFSSSKLVKLNKLATVIINMENKLKYLNEVEAKWNRHEQYYQQIKHS